MRKFFLVSMLFSIGACSLPLVASDSPIVVEPGYQINVFPGKYTDDGKSFLYTYTYDNHRVDRFYVGKWYEFRQYYEGSGLYGPFGQWGEVEEYSRTTDADVVYMNLYPESGGQYGWYRLTKGILGDDYNYALPLYETKNYEYQEEYRDKPGWIYSKSWGVSHEQIGFTVYDSYNKEVMSFKYPVGYTGGYELNFFQLGEYKYIGIDDVKDADGHYSLLIYRIEDNNNVSFVSAAPTAKVSPRNPKRGESVTVSVDSAVDAEEALVQVVSASGQTMLNTKVPAGQSQLDINTSGYSQGIYVVNVSRSGKNKEAAKIIVR